MPIRCSPKTATFAYNTPNYAFGTMNYYPLNATQLDMLQEADPETLETDYSVSVCIDIPADRCDAAELAAAVQTVLDTLPYTHVHLVKLHPLSPVPKGEGEAFGVGEVMVSEDTSMPNNVWKHVMSDDEWNHNRQQMVRPFRMLEEPGIRMHVVRSETRSILWHEYNHLFFDGMSMLGVLHAVEDVLEGRPLTDQGDVMAQWNAMEHQSYDSEAYRRAQADSLEKFKDLHYTDICRETDNPWGQTLCGTSMLNPDHTPKGEGSQVSQSSIFTAAYALALAHEAGLFSSPSEGPLEVFFMTTTHGRTDRRLHAGVLGNFMKSMSLRINVSPSQTVGELLSQTSAALFGMMRRLAYPWTHLMRDLGVPPEQQVGTEMNISGTGIYEYMHLGDDYYPSYHIEMPRSRMHLLLVVQQREEGLLFSAEGSSALYTQQQLDRVARLTAEYTRQLSGDPQRPLSTVVGEATPASLPMSIRGRCSKRYL